MKENGFRSGFVSIIGRPNVGKSTLMNALLGEKLSIVTDKPQTTRNRITGIKNLEGGQIVFWDTPGIHKAKDLMNKMMVKTAVSTISEVDIIVFMVEGDKPTGGGDDFILGLLREAGKPVILAINKIDLVKKVTLLPLIESLSAKFPFKAVVPLSAMKGEGLDGLMASIVELLPEGPPYFPEDQITDLPERFIVSEILREKIYSCLHDEVPYSTGIEIEAFREEAERNLIVISTLIYVERESQKKILIGKKGEMIKEIGRLARKDMEALLGMRVYLEIFVKVKKGWSSSERILRELGME